MELLTQSAATVNPNATKVLDIGCGVGNYTLKLYQYLPEFDVDLVDLSQAMLDRATERIRQETRGEVNATQGNIRELALKAEHYDIVMAAATLHHLREQ